MGELKIVDLLIKKGGNVNATTINGYNPLMIACLKNNADLAELFLRNNAEVNQKSKNGWTPLKIACGNISSNCIFFQDNEIGQKIFQVLESQRVYNLKDNPIQIVRSLLKSGANVNEINKLNSSPLNEAIWSCNTDVVKSLLDNGANVEQTDDDGQTVLMHISHYTFSKYQKSIVDLLDRLWDVGGIKDTELRSKIKSNLLKKSGEKTQNKQIEFFNSEILKIVTLLVQYGANIKAKNKFGASPLVIAAQGGNARIVDFLIKSGSDVNDKLDSGQTAIFSAAREGHIEVINLLLQNGAEIDSPLNDGETPLMTAVWYGHVDVVKLLISKGANVKVKKTTGEYPLLWAASKFKTEEDPRYVEIFEMLEGAGARSFLEKQFTKIHGAIKEWSCNHTATISGINSLHTRNGTLYVYFKCSKCGKPMGTTFFDFTETDKEYMTVFRDPNLEKILIDEGWVKYENGKIIIPRINSEKKPKF